MLLLATGLLYLF